MTFNIPTKKTYSMLTIETVARVLKPFSGGVSIERSHLICSISRLTGFYIMGKLSLNGSNRLTMRRFNPLF